MAGSSAYVQAHHCRGTMIVAALTGLRAQVVRCNLGSLARRVGSISNTLLAWSGLAKEVMPLRDWLCFLVRVVWV